MPASRPKKAVSLMGAGVLVFALGACDDTDDPGTDPGVTEIPTDTGAPDDGQLPTTTIIIDDTGTTVPPADG